MTNQILLTSGFGQHHTNEIDPLNPAKKLTPYATISFEDIQALVDNPQRVEKPQAQWFIPSSLPPRNFKTQEAEGRYYAWLYMDSKVFW